MLCRGLAGAAFIMCRALIVAVARVRAARVLHQQVLDRIVRAPMRFFDITPVGETPATARSPARRCYCRPIGFELRLCVLSFGGLSNGTGRILNRFSRDVETVDMLLGPALAQLAGTAFQVTGSLIGITIASQGYFLPALIPILVFYFYVSRTTAAASECCHACTDS